MENTADLVNLILFFIIEKYFIKKIPKLYSNNNRSEFWQIFVEKEQFSKNKKGMKFTLSNMASLII